MSLALWAAFLIATESIISYIITAPTHMGIFIAQIASLLVIRVREPAGVGMERAEGIESGAPISSAAPIAR